MLQKSSAAKLSQSELETHLWKAADILRGHVDAGKFKDYIFALLFYRRLPVDLTASSLQLKAG